MRVSHRPISKSRRGAVLVEGAIVLPILMLIFIGLIVGALGIFQYQQVATLSREAARWASVRGGQYERDREGIAATPSSVFENAIRPRSVGMRPEDLSYTVTWTDSSKMPIYQATANPETWRRNNVTVTVNYRWNPIMVFSPVTLRSTSVMPIVY